MILYEKTLAKVCDNCGEGFMAQPNNRQKYCTEVCSRAVRRRRDREWRRADRERIKVVQADNAANAAARAQALWAEHIRRRTDERRLNGLA